MVLDIAGRLGIRTGRLVAPTGIAATIAGAALFVLPPHSTLAAIALGLAGIAAFALGTARQAHGRWWALAAGAISAALLFAALTVAGRGIALHAFGTAETCTVTDRTMNETGVRYHHYGFVHTLTCETGTRTLRTDPGDRAATGSTVTLLTDRGGLLEPDFAARHPLLLEVPAVLAGIALTTATIVLARRSVRSAN
ncbi:hypothetical protein GCM10027445_68860 [Amycolatopsis endophytica]|uniref:DUF3592 domain-containing protein n=1 Tax=Amycolatopsis endophytica TaxID=860233 RepID=A0A853B4H1_9PSEU|nr:hypothetical protein [Amycolatopsis endophytica]NYI89722.1 hypothetical protein [Amycolatopsis endophytica]